MDAASSRSGSIDASASPDSSGFFRIQRGEKGGKAVPRFGPEQSRNLPGDRVEVDDRRGTTVRRDAVGDRGDHGRGSATRAAGERDNAPGIWMLGRIVHNGCAGLADGGGRNRLDQVVGDPAAHQRTAELRGIARADRDQRGLERAYLGQLVCRGFRLGDAVQVDEDEPRRRFRRQRPQRGRQGSALYLDVAAGEPGAQRTLRLGVDGESACKRAFGRWRHRRFNDRTRFGRLGWGSGAAAGARGGLARFGQIGDVALHPSPIPVQDPAVRLIRAAARSRAQIGVCLAAVHGLKVRPVGPIGTGPGQETCSSDGQQCLVVSHRLSHLRAMRADRFARSGEVGVLNGELGLAPAQKRHGEERRNDAGTTEPGPEFTQGTPPGQRARRSSRDRLELTRSRPGADSTPSSTNPAGRDRRTSGQADPWSSTDPSIRAVMRFPFLHSGLERVLDVVTVRAYSMLSLILLAVPRRLPGRRRRTALAFLSEADDPGSAAGGSGDADRTGNYP